MVGEIGGNDYNYAFFQGKSLQEIRTYIPYVVGAIVNAVSVRILFNSLPYFLRQILLTSFSYINFFPPLLF